MKRLVLIALFSSLSWAQGTSTLIQKMAHHSLEFRETPETTQSPAKLALVIDLKSEGPSPLNPALIAAICTDKLARGRVGAVWTKTYQAEFERGADASHSERRMVSLDVTELTAAHLFLSIVLQWNRETQRYGMSAELAAHQFQKDPADANAFKSVTLWSSQLSAGDSIERNDLEPRLAQWLRRELGNLTLKFGKLNFQRPVRTKAPVYSRFTAPRPVETGPSVRFLEYQLGFSVGTPAVGNLHAGVWGTSHLPFAFQVSGMFWGRQDRALQGELLWLHDTQGALQQGVGLALIGFNEHVVEPASLSAGPATDVIDRLKPYLGPVYVVTWKNFRAELGVSFRLGTGQDSAIRPLFQFGYTPTL